MPQHHISEKVVLSGIATLCSCVGSVCIAMYCLSFTAASFLVAAGITLSLFIYTAILMVKQNKKMKEP
jgi:hypothetical protein